MTIDPHVLRGDMSYAASKLKYHADKLNEQLSLLDTAVNNHEIDHQKAQDYVDKLKEHVDAFEKLPQLIDPATKKPKKTAQDVLEAQSVKGTGVPQESNIGQDSYIHSTIPIKEPDPETGV